MIFVFPEYLKIYLDDVNPNFLSKYFETETLQRMLYVSFFCGWDYTKIYTPLCFYSRFYHSLIVAHMTWHFTHDKKETIMALLHDIGTPCFAHSIDYVFGDYICQESSEKDLVEMIQKDEKLLQYLKEDGLDLGNFTSIDSYFILENKSPMLCTDRLDGVFHTCSIGLQTHSLEQIEEVYHDMVVLQNELGNPEIGFQNVAIAEKFVQMVEVYAKELRGNRDKFVMQYISDMVKLAVSKRFISFEDLYMLKECDLIRFFSTFSSWNIFQEATDIVSTNILPEDHYFISFETKKRNTIPLVFQESGAKRIVEVSSMA